MSARNIVIGQKVDTALRQRAKELWREMTAEEKIPWQNLRANRLPGFHFRRQQIIDGFIVDFYCHAAGPVIEVDGPLHEANVEYDRARDAVIAARGLKILRFRNDEIRSDLKQVLDTIALACQSSLPRPRPSPLPAPGRGRG